MKKADIQVGVEYMAGRGKTYVQERRVRVVRLARQEKRGWKWLDPELPSSAGWYAVCVPLYQSTGEPRDAGGMPWRTSGKHVCVPTRDIRQLWTEFEGVLARRAERAAEAKKQRRMRAEMDADLVARFAAHGIEVRVKRDRWFSHVKIEPSEAVKLLGLLA